MSNDSGPNLPPFPIVLSCLWLAATRYLLALALWDWRRWTSRDREQLAQRIISEIESKEKPALNHDSFTNNLIYQYRKLKEAL